MNAKNKSYDASLVRELSDTEVTHVTGGVKPEPETTTPDKR